MTDGEMRAKVIKLTAAIDANIERIKAAPEGGKRRANLVAKNRDLGMERAALAAQVNN